MFVSPPHLYNAIGASISQCWSSSREADEGERMTIRRYCGPAAVPAAPAVPLAVFVPEAAPASAAAGPAGPFAVTFTGTMAVG